MIDHLMVAKAATFFTTKRSLTGKSIQQLFTDLRTHYNVRTNNHFKYVRVEASDTHWSAICFSYEQSPTFLDHAAKVKDTICGYLMLVEFQGHVAVLSSRIHMPKSFKSKYLAPAPIERVEGAIAKADAIFQKIRIRNMSVSPYAMRNKTLEAPDLANVVGPSGSRRYAPQVYTVTTGGISRTATPRTGRIAERSERIPYLDLVEFAKNVIGALVTAPADVSPFIRTFARPMSLAEALVESEPVTLAMDTNRLLDLISGDNPIYRLIKVEPVAAKLSADELRQLIIDLDQPMMIEGNNRRRIARLENGDEAASINLNTNKISLRSLSLGISLQIRLENTEFELGTDPEPKTLLEVLNDEDAFIVLFDNTRLDYIDGQVFRDETLLDGGEEFLRHLYVDLSLQQVTSEKGTFTAAHTAFDTTSTFGAIVNHIAANDTVLVCDDLGDEWADFIGIKEGDGYTQISFYHAKHGALSLSAGLFHISISQAIKNLGNIAFPQERMQEKIRKWGETYNAELQRTQIGRTIRLSGKILPDVAERARMAPDVIRRVVIVTSSLSKQAVADAFREIQNGGRPTHTFVQLYWLLQSFFSACTEVGAVGTIVCQP